MRHRLPFPVRPSRGRGTLIARLLAAIGVLTLIVAGNGPGPGRTTPALAVVSHHLGFEATVLGWTSWYGSYGIGALGAGWCIDHGLRAPDVAFGYVPAGTPEIDANHAAAIAWAVSANRADDRVTAAAVMLAVHDLRGARYPFGRLDLARMTSADLAGFGGNEWAVLDTARRIKADAWWHHHLRGPLSFIASVDAPEPGEAGRLRLRLVDGQGVAVAGIAVGVHVEGARATGPTQVVTAADGTAEVPFVAAAGRNAFVATADVPDPQLQAYAATRAVAQRIAVPARRTIEARNEFVAAPPTTTTSVPPPSTTAAPTTTSTTISPPPDITTTSLPPQTTTTVAPPATAPPQTTTTTAPPQTTTSTAPPQTTTTTAPPETTTTTALQLPVPPPPPPPPPSPPSSPTRPPVTGPPRGASLPRTGSSTVPLTALGLVALGAGVAIELGTRRHGRRLLGH